MDDKDILRHIDDLIKTEHELRARLAAGELSTDEEQEQLRAVEAAARPVLGPAAAAPRAARVR